MTFYVECKRTTHDTVSKFNSSEHYCIVNEETDTKQKTTR